MTEDRCSRCGASRDKEQGINCQVEAPGVQSVDPLQVIACRDREISNLRALLRGATRRLENCKQTIDDVLEIWS